MAAARYKDRAGNRGVSFAILAPRARAEAADKAVALLRRRLCLYEASAWHTLETGVAREAAALVAEGMDACAALRQTLHLGSDTPLDGVLDEIERLFAENRRAYTATPAMHRAVEATMQVRRRHLFCRMVAVPLSMRAASILGRGRRPVNSVVAFHSVVEFRRNKARINANA